MGILPMRHGLEARATVYRAACQPSASAAALDAFEAFSAVFGQVTGVYDQARIT